MRFFNFHPMPYAEVDLDAIERNGSAWVTFSITVTVTLIQFRPRQRG